MLLPNMCEIQMGYTLRERLDADSSQGVPVVQLGNLAKSGLAPSGLRRFPISDVPERFLVRAGDVLFRSRGESNTAVALDGRFTEPALPISPLMVFRPRRDIVTPEFVEWAINQPSTQTFFDKWARGTSMRMIPRSCLDDLDIDVPDLATQRLIVEADKLATQEKDLSIALAEKKRQLISIMLEQRLQHGPLQGRK